MTKWRQKEKDKSIGKRAFWRVEKSDKIAVRNRQYRSTSHQSISQDFILYINTFPSSGSSSGFFPAVPRLAVRDLVDKFTMYIIVQELNERYSGCKREWASRCACGNSRRSLPWVCIKEDWALLSYRNVWVRLWVCSRRTGIMSLLYRGEVFILS